MTTRPTGRWRGVIALSLFAGAVGLLSQRPEVLLLATVGVGYAAYPRLVPSPPEPTLAVDRTVTPANPADGESVTVSVTVRNEGQRWLPDVRLVDGVPALLGVVDGTPRRATALEPGGETTFEYEVEATAGKHRFQPMTALTRDAAGAVERRTTVAEPTVVDCGVSVTSAALRDLTRRRTGVLRTDEGGSGLEFHRAREYRRGDPLSGIDWNRYARSGELGTIEFREERSGAVVLCVDVGDPSADGAGAASTPHAVARSVAAADRLAGALVDENHEVGLAALGPQFYWLPPRVGTGHRTQIQRALDADPAFVPATVVGDAGETAAGDGDDGSTDWLDRLPGLGRHERAPGPAGPSPTLSDGGRPIGEGAKAEDQGIERLRERLGPSTQVMVLSPLADDGIVDAVRRLEAAGNLVTVVSPDTTSTETVGNRLAASERTTRMRTLRRVGVPVVDWQTDDHLGNTLAVTLERFE